MLRLPIICTLLCALLATPLQAQIQRADPAALPVTPLGTHLRYLQEGPQRFELAEAAARLRSPEARTGNRATLNFGLGAAPVWLWLPLQNKGGEALLRRLTVETSWLDNVDITLVQNGRVLAAHALGDRLQQPARPVDERFFSVDLLLPPGDSDVYLRVATPDPLLVPVLLRSVEAAQREQRAEGYFYGFIYGFMLALLAYNLLLYSGLRRQQYLFYAIYLASFLILNISYTGHGFWWLWPQAPLWQQWAQPMLMGFCALSGLQFANRFLHLQRLLPLTWQTIRIAAITMMLGIWFAIVLDLHATAILVAFTLVAFYSASMLALGLLAARAGNIPARYFLAGAVSGSVGAGLTCWTVWGWLPFTSWAYHAAEIGFVLDATLLALALSQQFRTVQAEKRAVEAIAESDPLTGLANRRAFHQRAWPLWREATMTDRDIALILLDVDDFKTINDRFGHSTGDKALVALAGVLAASARRDDLVARWGGEEFVLLLPGTGLKAAIATAERLREAIARLQVPELPRELRLTASFGVVQRYGEESLDELITHADRYLYQCKEEGKDRIRYPQQAGALAH